jgi:hypothetical protein
LFGVIIPKYHDDRCPKPLLFFKYPHKNTTIFQIAKQPTFGSLAFGREIFVEISRLDINPSAAKPC